MKFGSVCLLADMWAERQRQKYFVEVVGRPKRMLRRPNPPQRETSDWILYAAAHRPARFDSQRCSEPPDQVKSNANTNSTQQEREFSSRQVCWDLTRPSAVFAAFFYVFVLVVS